MSDDWNTVVKIGSKAGRGGGGPRETTVKGKSQLNAAMRSGTIVATEKKYGTANAASSSGSGQFLTKVDRSDDIVKPKTGDDSVKRCIALSRTAKGWDQPELGRQAGISAAKIKDYESGRHVPEGDVQRLEKVLGVYIRGVLQGQPRPVKQFKRNPKAAEGK